jgi:pyruvate ferredoxin oxidoreductase gamma subunit
VSDQPIRIRTAIQEPTMVAVLDPSLLRLVQVDQGLQPGGTVVLNTSKSPEEIRKKFGIRARLAIVDANRIAREEIGRVITNTTMLGAMIAAAPIVPAERLEHALQERFGRIAQKNIAAFRRAQKDTSIHEAV